MKSSPIPLKSIAVTFVLALVFYVIAYSWLSKRQTGKGPWQVTFTKDLGGTPEIVVNQPALGISNVTVRFQEEKLAPTNSVGTVAFTKPNLPVPFGALLFDDLMFLPGTITLDLFGHEVELLRRVLVLNRREVTWQSDAVYSLAPTNKLPAEVRAKTKGGYKRQR